MSHMDMPGQPLPLRWRIVGWLLVLLGCAAFALCITRLVQWVLG